MANERSTSVWDALVDSPEEAENLRLRIQADAGTDQDRSVLGVVAKRRGTTAPRYPAAFERAAERKN